MLPDNPGIDSHLFSKETLYGGKNATVFVPGSVRVVAYPA
jgi:hypothetical protein